MAKKKETQEEVPETKIVTVGDFLRARRQQSAPAPETEPEDPEA